MPTRTIGPAITTQINSLSCSRSLLQLFNDSLVVLCIGCVDYWDEVMFLNAVVLGFSWYLKI